MVGSCARFLRQLAHSLKEPGWAKRSLSSKYQESVLWLLVAASDHRRADEEAGGWFCCIFPHCCRLHSHRLKWLLRDLKGQCFLFPLHFSLFPFFGNQTLKHTRFQVALLVRNPPAIAGDIRGASWEDFREEGMAPTPVFLPGESHGHRSLAGYSPWGLKESKTEATEHARTGKIRKWSS